MYEKIKSMQKINSMGLNMHKWFIPKDYTEFLTIINKLRFLTIRTDHSHRTHDLPFYIVNIDDEKKERAEILQEIRDIWNTAYKEGFKLIMSDGIKFDKIQEYNMMINIRKDGSFIFEASGLKVPLRHMYKYPEQMLSCTGEIGEAANHWVHHKFAHIDKAQMRKDIEDLYYTYQDIIFNKTIEITKYPTKVGTHDKKIVFWQMQDYDMWRNL